jgi:hypothetical protein
VPTIRTFDGAGGGCDEDCVTVTDRPAITRVAVRVAPVLAATLKLAVADPVRVVPSIVIQEGTPVTVHEQVAPVVTAKLPLEADPPSVTDPGVTV